VACGLRSPKWGRRFRELVEAEILRLERIPDGLHVIASPGVDATPVISTVTS
jgi:hypothetical protein